MTARRPAEVFPPGEYLAEELEARGWTQADLAELLAVPLQAVSDVIAAKRRVSPEIARALAVALGTSPELWLNLESAYRLCGD
jgi:HTH-type transcriptional regulator/antitoxin HigA